MKPGAHRGRITLERRSQRRLAERLAVRFPRLRTAIAKAVWRSPNSRLRRAIVRIAVKVAWEAFNRRDLEVTFALYHRDCLSSWPPELATLGLPRGTTGREERVREQERVLAEWRELTFESTGYVDLGDGRLLTAGRMTGVGLESGATVDTQWTAVLDTVDGQVVRERIYTDNREALKAVGLAD